MDFLLAISCVLGPLMIRTLGSKQLNFRGKSGFTSLAFESRPGTQHDRPLNIRIGGRCDRLLQCDGASNVCRLFCKRQFRYLLDGGDILDVRARTRN